MKGTSINSDSPKFLMIFNPQAGNGRAAKLLPEIQTAFNNHQLEVEIFHTERTGAGTEELEQRDLSQYEAILAAGGDGTIFEVINGLYRNPAEKRPRLGIIPIGTGNAFVRDMQEDPISIEQAVSQIAAKHTRQVDVGKYRMKGEDYYFLNILGLGFVADVGLTAQKLKFLGNFSYTLGVLYQVLFLKPFPARIVTEEQEINEDCLFIEISNTRYTSNFLMAPNARTDDGLLDVTVLKGLSRRKLLGAFPKIFTGEHIELPEVLHFQCRRIDISTDTEKILTPDGELTGSTPIQVECLQRAIDVYWPIT